MNSSDRLLLGSRDDRRCIDEPDAFGKQRLKTDILRKHQDVQVLPIADQDLQVVQIARIMKLRCDELDTLAVLPNHIKGVLGISHAHDTQASPLGFFDRFVERGPPIVHNEHQSWAHSNLST